MIPKLDVNDILLYNSQGTIDVGIIVKIIIMSDSVLYELNRGCTIREEVVVKNLGNAERLKEEYEDDLYELARDRQ